MMEIIQSLIVAPLLGGPPYLALATLILACCMGFPFSSDITMIVAGVLVSTGLFELKTTILVSLTSILVGDSITFFIGRKWGSKLVQTVFFKKFISEKKLQETSAFLNRNASRFIFMVRFTPVARSVVFFTAGAMKIPPSRFFIFNALSTSFYVPLLTTISFHTANQSKEIVQAFQTYSRLITGIILLFLCGLYLRKLQKKRENLPSKII